MKAAAIYGRLNSWALHSANCGIQLNRLKKYMTDLEHRSVQVSQSASWCGGCDRLDGGTAKWCSHLRKFDMGQLKDD